MGTGGSGRPSSLGGWLNCFGRRRPKRRDLGKPGELQRPVHVLGENPHSPKNVIVSSHYTLITFFPLTLFHLFHPTRSFANFYFLCIGFLQIIPAISITGGIPTLWGPLSLIILVDLILMANEDVARHKADAQVNGQRATILHGDTTAAGVVVGAAVGGVGAAVGVGLGELTHVRQGAQDRGDVEAQTQTPRTAATASWVDGTWADVSEGDVVRVNSHDAVPADLLLLRSSTGRECWVNTKPLDGETDMKLRLAPKPLAELLKDVDVTDDAGTAAAAASLPKLLRGVVMCEAPNNKINDTSAELRLADAPRLLATEENVLLRGCQLRNTDWILGLVLSCGPDTKVGYRPKGGSSDPQKPVLSDEVVNWNLCRQVILLVPLVIAGSTAQQVMLGRYDEQPWYRETLDTGFGAWVLSCFSYFLLCYSLIPISFYVTRNIIFTFSRYFMSQDLMLYDEVQDEPCRVRSMHLLEQLGQVSHVFSDKTGTLTSNRMEFRRCVFASVPYGCGDTAISRSLGKANTAPRRSQPLPDFAGNTPETAQFISFEEAEGEPSIWDALHDGGARGCALKECLVAMAVNHSVMLEMVHDKQIPSASSPDELAFVAAAEHFGLRFEDRQTGRGVLVLHDKHRNERHEIEVLEAFAYTSDRKRMSVIVHLPPALVAAIGGGCEYRIYSKGADSVIFERLLGGDGGGSGSGGGGGCSSGGGGSGGGGSGGGAAPLDGPCATIDQLSELLSEWAEVALRTLVWAKRELPELEAWRAEYKAAFNNPAEVAAYKTGEPCLITELQAQLESDLTLLGATAIEDKLQDGVPEILADLRDAGVKIWMLTGDKVGTAKNIAAACNILPQEAEVLEITTETFPVLATVKASRMLEVQRTLEASRPPPSRTARLFAKIGFRPKLKPPSASELHKQTVALDAVHPELLEVRQALVAFQAQLSEQISKESKQIRDSLTQQQNQPQATAGPFSAPCMVIDEKAIEYCTTLCGDVLTAVTNACRAVVACRARKDQKAQMLNLIKRGVPESCCLAIGDGANDVAMIKAAHVGIGIIGREGMEAVNNSDFAIGQFRFLRGLLLVHGRQNYRRYGTFCYFMFYQSSCVVFSLFLYSLLTEASGSLLYPYFIFDFFTVFYTPLALIVFGVNDQDVSKQASAETPGLYSASIERVYLTTAGFVRWLLEAAYLAVLLAYVPAACYGWSPGISLIGSNGDPSWAALAFPAYNCLVLVTLSRLGLEVHSWTVLEVTAWLLGIAALVLTNVMFSQWYPVPFPTIPDSQWGDLHNIVQIMYGQPAYWMSLFFIWVLALTPVFIIDTMHVDPTSPVRTALRFVARSKAVQRLRRKSEEMQDINDAWLSIPRASKNTKKLHPQEQVEPVDYEPSRAPMTEVPAAGAKESKASGGWRKGRRSKKRADGVSTNPSRPRGFNFSQDDRSAEHILGLADGPASRSQDELKAA